MRLGMDHRWTSGLILRTDIPEPEATVSVGCANAEDGFAAVWDYLRASAIKVATTVCSLERAILLESTSQGFKKRKGGSRNPAP